MGTPEAENLYSSSDSEDSEDSEWEQIRAQIFPKVAEPPPVDAEGALAVLRKRTRLDHKWNNGYYIESSRETCLWLYDTGEVQRWIQQRRGVLCITGSPGSGKSVLAHSVLQQPARIQNLLAVRGPALLLGYLVEHTQASVSDLVRSFLVQIYDAGHTSSLLRLLGQTLPWPDGEVPDNKLEHALLECLADVGREFPVVLVIDGVDKLPLAERCDRLVPFLSSLMEAASAADSDCHLIYTEREHPDTPRLATISDNVACVRTDAHNRQDMRTWLAQCIRCHGVRDNDHDLRRELVDASAERAGSCFAVALKYENEASRLFHISRTNLEQTFSQQLPQAVRQYWSYIVREALDIDQPLRSSQLNCLGWLLVSYRPLTLREFCWLCNEQVSDNIAVMRSMVLNRSGCLANLDDQAPSGRPDLGHRIVSLIQPSLELYLKSDASDTLFTNHLGVDRRALLKEGHRSFATAGLRCLETFLPSYRDDWGKSLPKFTEPALSSDPVDIITMEPGTLQELENHAGLTYTVRYLLSHLSAIGPNEEIFRKLFEHDMWRLVRPGQVDLFSMWAHLHNCLHRKQVYGPSVTFLHVLAERNMTEWVAWALASDIQYKVKTANDESILHWAAFYGSKESVDIICQKEATSEVVSRAGSALKPTDDTVLSLINHPDMNYRSPLVLAATRGHAEIAAKLFSYQGRVRTMLREKLRQENVAPNRMNQTLQRIGNGFYRGYSVSDRRLQLVMHVDAEKDAVTALCVAIRLGNVEVVQALINQGLNWGSVAKIDEERGHTPPEGPGIGPTHVDPVWLALSLGGQGRAPLSPATKAIVRELKNAEFENSGYANNLPNPAPTVDQLFMATKVHLDDETGVNWKQMPVSELLQYHNILNGNHKITWIHLPANNMQWVEILLLRLMEQKGAETPEIQRDRILRRELWTDRQTLGSARSYISFMKPGCDTDRKSDAESLVLFIPYIHWETQKLALVRETFLLCKFLLEADTERLPSFVDDLRIENDDLLNVYAPSPRTTLSLADDSNYTNLSQALMNYLKTLKDSNAGQTSARETLRAALELYRRKSMLANNDLQLIDQYATNDRSQHPLHIRRTLDQSFYYMLDSTAARNKSQVITRFGQGQKWSDPAILMVDQLWLWKQDNVIVTAFPRRQALSADDPDPFDMTDVLERISWKLRSGKIDYCCDASERNVILGIIDECVGAWIDAEKKLGEKFRFLDMFSISISRIADSEAACYERFVNQLGQPGHQNRLAINTESYFLQEIKDIQDELRMIKAVLVSQLEVIAEFCGFKHPAVSRALDKVNAMQDEAERTHKQLNALMDLQQRHATLWEAQSTGLQGNTIMVFTVVTILFLPASFMTSFFALPIRQFQYDAEDDEKMKLAYVVTWITVFTIPVAVLFISFAFYINNILNFLSRITGYDRRIARKAAEAERMRRGRGVLAHPDMSRATGLRSRDRDNQANNTRGKLWFRGGKKSKSDDLA
ncbi:uncharacterized protein BDW70DRAFT_165101 [Aspergillus foveolatus]|uniref:uncharacterized protein n=1 Tax=Aspergillus foveolatus TaxID=210207 RepID=UPI003CCE3631